MRVGILGAGTLGEACAHTLAQADFVRAIDLYHDDTDLAQAIEDDLKHMTAWRGSVDIAARLPRELRDAGEDRPPLDLLILAIGAGLSGPGGDRTAVTVGTMGALSKPRGGEPAIADLLSELAKDPPLLLVLPNHVDLVTTLLEDKLEWPEGRIFGLGTMVESARYRKYLADATKLDPRSFAQWIIGEHGQRVAVFGEDPEPVRESPLIRDRALDHVLTYAEEIRHLRERSLIRRFERKLPGQRAALADQDAERVAITLGQTGTRFAIAGAVSEVAEAVAFDRRRVLPLSRRPPYPSDVAYSLPWSVGARGLDRCLVTECPEELRECHAGLSEELRSVRRLRGAWQSG